MGFVVKAVKSVVKTVVGVVSKVVGGIFGFSVGGGGSKKTKAANNLNKSLEPEAFVKIAFGKIAAPLDVRFWEVWGTNGTKFDEVIALAGHRINSVQELYMEQDLAVDAAGVVQTKFVGILTRTANLGVNGQTALSVGGGTQWTSAATFDGCPHIKLAWVPDEKKLPNGIPNRYTQVIECALVYDPRRDSTVPGGSGSHRVNDRTTWQYSPLDTNGQPIGRNNALQALWYLLGWYVPIKNGAGTVIGEALRCGRGVDPQDINMATFIAGANACEVAGYYTDMILSTEDSHTSNEDKITADGLIARLIDPGGLWSYYANVNDTASIAVELTDADILEGVNVTWNEYKGMSEQFNQVTGKFVNPSNITLFQAFPYPMVRDAVYEASLGVKRKKTQDFPQVLDNTLAQRLARLLLNQGQYQGEFTAGFNYRAVKAQAWSVVRYTSERFGWTKLFRVYRHEISTNGGVGMLLKEIHASIWSAGTVTAPIAPGAGVLYDPRQEIAATGVTITLTPMTGAGGTLADGFRIGWNAPPENVRRSEIRYRLVGTTFWLTAGPVERDVTTVLIGPLFSGAIYEAQIRHISIHEIPGPWVFSTTAPANGAGQFSLGTTGNVNYAAIAAAGGTAVWSAIIGPGKPADDATRNRWYVSASDPGGANGDGWKDTSTTPNKHKLKIAGVWTDVSSLVTNTAEIVDGANLGLTALWTGVVGNAKPENYATTADNVVKNGSLSSNADGWSLGGGASWIAAGAPSDPSSGFIRFPFAGGNVTAFANDASPIPLNEAKKLFVNFSYYIDGGSSAGIIFQFSWLKSDLSPSSINPYPQYSFTTPQGAHTPASLVVEPPSDARYYQALFIRGPATGNIYVSNLRIAKTESGGDVTLNAQITSEISGSASKTIAADYTGAVTGSYPVFAPTVLRSGVSIKTDASVTYTATKLSDGTAGADGGTISLSTAGSTKGEVTPSAFNTGASEIKWRLTITIGSVIVGKHDCSLKKGLGAPPSGGGGGGSSKLAYVSANQSQSTTTYVPAVSSVPQLAVASGEKLYVSGNVSYEVTGGTGARSGTFKNQYSVDNSTWTDFGSPIAGSAGTGGYNSGGEYIDPTPGGVNLAQNVTPAAGTYYVRTVFVISATGRTITLQGENVTYEAKV